MSFFAKRHIVNFFHTMLWLVFLCIQSTAQTQTSWKILRYDNRDYVSLESIKSIYGFTKSKRTGDKISLEIVTPIRLNNIVWDITLNNQECFLNGIKFVLTYSVVPVNGEIAISKMDLVKLIDPVLRPKYIANAGNFRTVILDAGHGGDDSGACNSYGSEKNYNMLVVKNVQKKLTAAGYKVFLTRSDDRFVTLQERVNIANTVKDNAIFISVHFNSGGGNSAHGVETFTLSPTGVAHYGSALKDSDFNVRNGNTHDSANVALATAVHSNVIMNLRKSVGTKNKSGTASFMGSDRGIKRARFNVLTGVMHPAILLEGGFMSHPYEARLIANPLYQEYVALGICEAIGKYKTAVSKTPINNNVQRR